MMPTQKAEALFDFDPTAEVELKIQKGDVVTVQRMSVGEGWWEGELRGKRGLFPSSFVKLIPMLHEAVDSSHCTTPPTPPTPPTPTPLTPRSTKKAFMETMLAPEPSALDEIYDEERAIEMFVPGYTEVAIMVGPKWKGRPPVLTTVVKEPKTQPRLSGIKHVTLYEVETRELGSCVTRKYKQFLWLYDRLAENLPCISLPPLPVKHFSGLDSKVLRRKGLQHFLTKVASHPVLGCTRFLKVFLTDEDAKPDKEWKIGKHLSVLSHNIKLPKTSRKLFHAPVYCTVKYPPYNVPIGQLASIEKFSRFSRLLETNVNTLHLACSGLSMAQRDMMTNVNLLAKDLKCFARGMESTGGAQRRKLAKSSVSANLSIPLPNTGQSSFYMPVPSEVGSVEVVEENSGGEEGEGGGGGGGGTQWNWREDEKFNTMVGELQDLASGMQRTSRVFQAHQEAMEAQVMGTLQEYSGVINTFPGLVRLHEEAMEFYNSSKNKDSKKEAEEVRQNCETLNNILLAEFDYFSNNLVDDFEAMMQRFLRRQGDFHRKLADEWDALHTRYMEHVSRRKSDTPIHNLSYSPIPQHHTTSTSHTHLHTLHPHSSSSQRTPSDVLTSSGGSFGTSHSQDDVTSTVPFMPTMNVSQSQSHPNIHSIGLGHTTSSKSHSSSAVTDRADLKSSLTQSDTHVPPSTDSGGEPQHSPNYVNYNVDKLTVQSAMDSGNGDDHSRRLKSLSPLEQSIERELEKAQDRALDRSSADVDHDYENPGVMLGRAEGEKDGASQPRYANWQFAEMNKKSQSAAAASTNKPLYNGGPKSLSAQQKGAKKPNPSGASIPRKPLKPPSPFKLQNLSDLTSLESTSSSSFAVPPPSQTKWSSPPKSVSPFVSEGKKQPLEKAKSTSKLHEIQGESSRDMADTTSQSTRNINLFLPSQMGKPRSNTTANTNKKRPVLPPSRTARGSVKSQPKLPVMKEIEGTFQERRERLDSSGELERSFGSDSSTPTATKPYQGFSATIISSRSCHSNVRVESATSPTGGAAASLSSSKTPGKKQQSSPSSELMRKLSQRRLKLEQQLVMSGNTRTSGSTISSGTGEGSSRCTSTSSTQSELVCTYSTKRSQDSYLDGVEGSSADDVERRSKEDANLAKYGIMEDIEGGSFVI